MKIGRFAKVNNVSIDTLRHYMDLKLLLPIKSGHQYDFDQSCQNDFDEIQDLKTLKFSLKEILTLIDYLRLSGFSTKEYNAYMSDILHHKKTSLLEEEKAIDHALMQIESRINTLEQSTIVKTHHFGIHIGLIPYLACPSCKASPLNLECQSIHSNMVFQGKLTCSCGGSLIIDDGILISDTFVEILYETDIGLDNYIEETGEDIIANIRKGINWFTNTVETRTFDKAIVLEIGSGSGFFIRSAFSYIENCQYYIAVDHDISRHRFLKKHLETADISLPIQFICSDFKKIPLNDSCVDILVDFTGTSNIGFDTPEFMLDTIDTYLKPNCELMASYIVFDKFSTNHFLPIENRKLFNKESLSNNLTHHQFTINNTHKGDYHTNGGPYEDYFTENDKVYTMWLYANRKI